MKTKKRLPVFFLAVIMSVNVFAVTAFGAYASRADNFYSLGYRFTATFTETDGGVHVSLGTIKESDAGNIAALAASLKPEVYCMLYYGDGKTSEFTVAFDDSLEADVSFVGASGAYVDVPHHGESGFAIKPDGTSEASYMYGNIDNSYDPYIFADVAKKTLWYYDYTYLAVYYGFLNGVDFNKFAPGDYMTYAQAITIAARMNAVYYGRDASAVFKETSPWYSTYIEYARANGIPCNATNYNAPITRREYVHLFRSALPDEAFAAINTLADNALPDVKMTDLYADDIYLFYRAGILNGTDDALSFKPDAYITRSEVSAIICRMFYFDRQSF